jgi:lipopolysaccharide export system protein LptA
MRTLVLVAAVLLLGSLVAFLAIGRWKNPFNSKELPKRLGIEIQQEANGVTYTQAHGGHTLFKIHASKVVQLKKGNALLHDVKIELYGADGSRVDRIEGSEFEYDQKAGTAKATGTVEITLMRPGVAPAIAPKVAPVPAADDKAKGKPLAAAAETAARGEIHVKTSGLTFDQKSGVATTDQHVEFSLAQGEGSSMGATYDSEKGLLVLDRTVELTTRRGAEPVQLHANHAEFDRNDQRCRLHTVTADYHGGQAVAGDAEILFRDDGSAVRLDALNGFTLTTATGGHLVAPSGILEFNEHNQPRHGHLEGGVEISSTTESESAEHHQKIQGTSSAMDLEFTSQGELRHVHLERGVELQSVEETLVTAKSGSGAVPLRESRNWQSPIAEIEFRTTHHGQGGQGKIEPATIHGTGGVVVNGESQRGLGAVVPSRMAADELTGEFGVASTLTAMTGVGHASVEQTTATGSRQTTSGDRLEAHFAVPPTVTPSANIAKPTAKATGSGGSLGSAAQIESAVIEGHVVLIQYPATNSSSGPKSSAKPGAQAQTPLRATAGRAVYEGRGEWLHLSLMPRVENGDLQLTADKIDVSEASGDAYAHGNVKATWLNTGKNGQPGGGSASKSDQNNLALGGNGPAHVIATEAQLHQATGEATFRGQARLWQQANSISAPLIVLDRTRQTLAAHSTDAAEPVRLVLLSAGSSGQGPNTDSGARKQTGGKSTAPVVIRLRGGDLQYSDSERKAVMHGSALGTVTAETGTATSVSNEVELLLQPQGKAAAKDGATSQVDRVTARGHVVVTSEGRRGSGEQLVYTGEDGEYVLTGTAAVPPTMTDPARGSVTGEALIFHSGDESVSVEGGQRKTSTDTRTPK